MKSLIAAAALAVSLVVPAMAENPRNCAPREFVVDRLTSAFGETRQSIGLTEGAAIETWANTDTGSWTVTATMPDGITCVEAAGMMFETLAEALPPQGDPA